MAEQVDLVPAESFCFGNGPVDPRRKILLDEFPEPFTVTEIETARWGAGQIVLEGQTIRRLWASANADPLQFRIPFSRNLCANSRGPMAPSLFRLCMTWLISR